MIYRTQGWGYSIFLRLHSNLLGIPHTTSLWKICSSSLQTSPMFFTNFTVVCLLDHRYMESWQLNCCFYCIYLKVEDHGPFQKLGLGQEGSKLENYPSEEEIFIFHWAGVGSNAFMNRGQICRFSPRSIDSGNILLLFYWILSGRLSECFELHHIFNGTFLHWSHVQRPCIAGIDVEGSLSFPSKIWVAPLRPQFQFWVFSSQVWISIFWCHQH